MFYDGIIGLPPLPTPYLSVEEESNVLFRPFALTLYIHARQDWVTVRTGRYF